MSVNEQTVQQRWIAFGETGAVGSISVDGAGFQVRMLGDDRPRGSYASLSAAKGALHAALGPGAGWPEFREH